MAPDRRDHFVGQARPGRISQAELDDLDFDAIEKQLAEARQAFAEARRLRSALPRIAADLALREAAGLLDLALRRGEELLERVGYDRQPLCVDDDGTDGEP
jgi:hypothetical protein